MPNCGKMRFVLVAVVLLCIIQQGSTLRCNMAKTGMTYNQKTMECPEDWICLTKREIYTDEPETRTSACSRTYSRPPNTPCQWSESLNDGKRTQTCYCDTDLCNAGAFLRSTNVLVTLSALVTFLAVLMHS